MTMTEQEVTDFNKDDNAFGDIDFCNRVITSIVSTGHGLGGQLLIQPDQDGGNSHHYEWSEPTEEGYRHVEARVCDDPDCNPDDRSFRDMTAEAAGY